MAEFPAHILFPIGDSALTIDFGNIINKQVNQKVLSLFQQLRENPVPGMIEAVPAYSSLTIYYDLFQLHNQISNNETVYERISSEVEKRLQNMQQDTVLSTRNIEIPVCYTGEYAPDIAELAAMKNISLEELIHIHTSATYRVYMLGFLPGFAYMGEVEERIEAPRKQQPRQKVEAGSVGIAGKQTGIYPLASPGGWQLIGRTPLKLFTPIPQPSVGGETSANSFCLLQPGDEVRFHSITKDEFENH